MFAVVVVVVLTYMTIFHLCLEVVTFSPLKLTLLDSIVLPKNAVVIVRTPKTRACG